MHHAMNWEKAMRVLSWRPLLTPQVNVLCKSLHVYMPLAHGGSCWNEGPDKALRYLVRFRRSPS